MIWSKNKEDSREEIYEEKANLQELKSDLAKCTDATERQSIEEEIASVEEWLGILNSQVGTAAKSPADFKADKREFLIDYINRQIHGDDWRSKT